MTSDMTVYGVIIVIYRPYVSEGNTCLSLRLRNFSSQVFALIHAGLNS